MKARLAISALMLVASAASAHTWVDLNITSRHIGNRDYYRDTTVVRPSGSYTISERKPYNENNLGVGFVHELSDSVEVRGGFYNNSFHDTSMYLAVAPHTSYNRLLSVGAVVGFVTGYDNEVEKRNKYQFAILPSVVITPSPAWRITVNIIPGVTADSTTVLTLSVGIKLR